MPAGRPPAFKSEEEASKQIEAYFEYIKGVKERQTFGEGDKSWQEDVWIRHPEEPTITGLALFLGFESRQSFYDYEKKEEFTYSIKRARLRIESNYEQNLFSKFSTGPIFALKNFGWTDKQEVASDSKVEVTVKYEKRDNPS